MTREDYSLTFPSPSIARYSFIQLSELWRQWRERKCPNFETVAKWIRTQVLSIESQTFHRWATALHYIHVTDHVAQLFILKWMNFYSLWIMFWNESQRFGFSTRSLGHVMFSKHIMNRFKTRSKVSKNSITSIWILDPTTLFLMFILTYSGRRAVAGWHVAVGRAHDGYGAGDRGWGWGWRQHPGGRVVVRHLGRTLQNRTWGARLKVFGDSGLNILFTVPWNSVTRKI